MIEDVRDVRNRHVDGELTGQAFAGRDEREAARLGAGAREESTKAARADRSDTIEQRSRAAGDRDAVRVSRGGGRDNDACNVIVIKRGREIARSGDVAAADDGAE